MAGITNPAATARDVVAWAEAEAAVEQTERNLAQFLQSTVGGLSELRLWVRAGNQASARVAEKAGFTRAPTLDRTVDVRGEPWTALYYTHTRQPRHESSHSSEP